LTDRLSWRWCFYLNLPVGFISIVFITLFFDDPVLGQTAEKLLPLKQKFVKLDLLGTVVFVPAITMTLLAMQWGGVRYGWSDWRIILLLVLGGVLLGVFALQQWYAGTNATLPLRLVRNRSLMAGMWFSFCVGSVLAVIDYYVRLSLSTSAVTLSY
jgi:hypothetical protein